jgi:NAD(P)H dehydrogenase (quinone)
MLVLAAGHGQVAQAIAGALASLPGPKRFAPIKATGNAFAGALGYEPTAGIDTPGDRAAALAGATDLVVVPAFDPRAIEHLMSLVRGARNAGVARIHVVSMAGADVRSPVTLLRWIGLVEREAQESGLPHTLLRCGPFMQAIPMFLRRDARGAALVGPFRDRAFPWIDAEDAGAILAGIVRRHEAVNVCCQLSGTEEANFETVARVMSEVMGEPIGYVDVCLPEAQGMLQAGGFAAPRVRAVTEFWDYLVSGVVRPSCCDLGRQLLGRPARTLRQYFERVAAPQPA